MESLQGELKAVSQSKAMLEKELQEVITLTSTELEEYQEKVLELEDEVSENSFFKGTLICVSKNENVSLMCFSFLFSCKSHAILKRESVVWRMLIRSLRSSWSTRKENFPDLGNPTVHCGNMPIF